MTNTLIHDDAALTQLIQVNTDEYEILLARLSRLLGNATLASRFAAVLVRLSADTGESMTGLLAELENTSKAELTATVAYYMNLYRSPSTLLGISNVVAPNFYASRNVML